MVAKAGLHLAGMTTAHDYPAITSLNFLDAIIML